MRINQSLHLYDYNIFATNTIVNHLKTLPEGIIRENIKSVFPSVFDTLIHMYIIDKGWYSLLIKEYASDDYEAIKNSIEKLLRETKNIRLDELSCKQELLAKDFRNFISSNDMEQSDVFSSIEMKYAEVIQHIVNHGTYHRGNITAMLHQLGYSGATTDYGFYLYHLTR